MTLSLHTYLHNGNLDQETMKALGARINTENPIEVNLKIMEQYFNSILSEVYQSHKYHVSIQRRAVFVNPIEPVIAP